MRLKMTPKQALEKIKNIELSHIEYYDDDDYDYDSCIDSYEESDGTIEENYPDEIQVIEKSLEVLEFLKSRLDIKVTDDTLYAITITPLSQEDEKLLKEWLENA